MIKMLLALGGSGGSQMATPVFEGEMPQKFMSFRNQTAKEDAIIANIVENSKIELPEEYIEAQLDMVMRDLTQRLAYHDYNPQIQYWAYD